LAGTPSSPRALAAVGARVKPSPSSGPPTARILVSGSGFGAQESVSISFDRTPIAQTRTDASGAFSRVPASIPSAAVPGVHPVIAVGSISGKIATAKFTVNTDWPAFRHDSAHTGVNLYENTLWPGNVVWLTHKWTYQTGGDESINEPALVNGVLFTGSLFSYEFYALRASDGTLLWSYATYAPDSSAPSVSNGIVYFTSGVSVFALRAVTGAEVWERNIGSGPTAPVVVGGVVWVGSSSGQLFKLSAATGSVISSWDLLQGGLGTPTVAGGVVYVGGASGTLFALSTSSGQVLWTANGHAGDAVTVTNGLVYYGDNQDRLISRNAQTGSLALASQPLDGCQSIDTVPAVANGIVYVGSGCSACALDATTGMVLWISPIAYDSNPTVANGIVYWGTAGDGSESALDAATGFELWHDTDPADGGDPLVANGRLYFGRSDGTIDAYGLP
jgi:outer membrane protein assembly factor BamB